MKNILLIVIIFFATNLFAQDVDSYIEVLKSDLKTNKKALITQVMQFTEKQSEAFWPIYNDFEHELDKLSNQRIANIKDFAANYDSLSDNKADELIKKSFNFLEDRMKLNEKYYEKFAKALTPVVAAKFMQLEHQIQLVLDLSIASNLPLAKKPE